ncbi:MAG: helix-turn-helix domain-containing protein [Elusimicrobia bacterium]|nr:helix-turn-helix domain-containing protein [Elusimicrobiota bacterium]
MPQKALARQIGSSQAIVSKIETGRVDMRISTLARILEALRCKLLLLAKATPEFDEACATDPDASRA